MYRYQTSIDRVLLRVLIYSTFLFVLGLKTLSFQPISQGGESRK